MPLISVVCATYNRGPLLRITIDSVLAQTHADLELIVVSDGSTDSTDNTVTQAAKADGRVRLIAIDHVGHPSPAMNTGIAAASGSVIAYIDHDDMWTPGHLRTVLDVLEDGADIAAAGSTWLDPQGRVISARPAAALFWHPEIQVINPVFENSQAAHWATLIDGVGPWRESPHGLEDWDMWLRLADTGARFQTVQRPTVLKTMARSNRHRRLPKAHALEYATFPDAPSARRGVAALRRPAVAQKLQVLGAEDVLDWYGRLANTPEFVFPVGFAGSRDEAHAGIPEAMAAARVADTGLEDPVSIRLAPRAGRVALLQDINCMTAEHAARYQATVRATQPSVFELIKEVTAPFDGVVAESVVSGGANQHVAIFEGGKT